MQTKVYLVDIDVVTTISHRGIEIFVDIEEGDSEEVIEGMVADIAEIVIENHLENMLENQFSNYNIDDIEVGNIRQK